MTEGRYQSKRVSICRGGKEYGWKTKTISTGETEGPVPIHKHTYIVIGGGRGLLGDNLTSSRGRLGNRGDNDWCHSRSDGSRRCSDDRRRRSGALLSGVKELGLLLSDGVDPVYEFILTIAANVVDTLRSDNLEAVLLLGVVNFLNVRGRTQRNLACLGIRLALYVKSQERGVRDRQAQNGGRKVQFLCVAKPKPSWRAASSHVPHSCSSKGHLLRWPSIFSSSSYSVLLP